MDRNNVFLRKGKGAGEGTNNADAFVIYLCLFVIN